MKLMMGPYAQFGIINDYDENRDYRDEYNPKKYNCVSVPDDLINDWWLYLLEMNVIPFGHPPIYTTALDRWGITIIPPESLPLFIDIVLTKSTLKYKKKVQNRALNNMLNDLIFLLRKASDENKYVIHYGV